MHIQVSNYKWTVLLQFQQSMPFFHTTQQSDFVSEDNVGVRDMGVGSTVNDISYWTVAVSSMPELPAVKKVLRFDVEVQNVEQIT
jgi:hypothetical protein